MRVQLNLCGWLCSNVGLLLYYITDRNQFSGAESARQAGLLACIGEAAAAGVDFIQLREKDLSARALLDLALRARDAVPRASQTKLLINSRVDVAIASGADGVHLRSSDISASDARVIFHKCGITDPTIGVSCHSLEDVRLAESHGADFAVFGPVFGKADAGSVGVNALANICQRAHAASPKMPVLALGCVTVENAWGCMQAGADGIAGIRLFQQVRDIHG